MLSKPKYMLPGNLSQGAPILEPDMYYDSQGNPATSNTYNFTFVLDGDEKIEKSKINIYTLQPLTLALEDLSLKWENFVSEEGETLKDSFYFREVNDLPITAKVDKDRNLIFTTIIRYPIDKVFYPNCQVKFVNSNFHGKIPFDIKFNVSNWGNIYFSDNASAKEIEDIDYFRGVYTDLFKDGKSNKFEKLEFSGQSNLKLVKNEEGKIGFQFLEEEIECTYLLNHSTIVSELQLGQPWVNYKAAWTTCSNWEIIGDEEVEKVAASDSKYNKIYYKTVFPYSENLSLSDYDTESPSVFKKITDQSISHSKWKSNNSSRYQKFLQVLFEFYPPLKNSEKYKGWVYGSEENVLEGYKITSTNLTIKLADNIQNLILEQEKEFSKDTYPKEANGNYRIFTNAIDGSLFDEGKYCWNVEVWGENQKIVSDTAFFTLRKKRQEIVDSTTMIEVEGEKIQEKNYLNNPKVLEYKIEIVDDNRNIFYNTPFYQSNNLSVTFPFEFFPFPNYKMKYTVTTVDLQQKEFIEIRFQKCDIKERFLSLSLINNTISLTNISEKNINALSIFRINKEQNKIIFLKKVKISSNETIQINDEYNNFSNYYYCFINEKNGEAQVSDMLENKNDKWRLILTKGEKNGIIEEERICHYQIDKVYDFYYNLVSGSIGNNAETTINTNFTNMPSVQKGFSNYWSGSLSALMGVCDERGEFTQTIEQEKALEQLVLDQEHDKFLLDREGNVWQVEISAPLTIANQDGLIQTDKLIDLKTITINWVQVGSPTQIVFDFEE